MPSVAIVGASRGIGAEFVRQFSADKWEVFATVRKAEDQRLLAETPGVQTGIADVTDEASLREFATSTLPEWIDLLIINAGVGSREPRLEDVEPANWTRVMTVNALGPLLVARTVGTKVRQGGTIAALSSTLGSIADNGGGLWSYRMSKAALNMGMSCLAIELKPRDVNTVVLHPGWVKTDMGGEQAPLSPDQSVAGMRKVIAGLTGTGGFFDYSGKALPW
jgi:NAD(P)-dependent dehydrogenase (short-subunit alcohol dehydrogenase family)